MPIYGHCFIIFLSPDKIFATVVAISYDNPGRLDITGSLLTVIRSSNEVGVNAEAIAAVRRLR
jgi:hypothetical protein